MLTGIPPRAEKDRRYSVKEAVALLGISRNTLRNHVKQGRIAAIHTPSRNVFFLGQEINRYWNQTI
jgi:excisionase family DNA binding protein